MPSMAIVQFVLDPRRARCRTASSSTATAGCTRSRSANCRASYRTGYPVTLWPVELTGARC